jgi:hypothetical protein
MKESMELSTFEKIGVRNAVNKMVFPFIEEMEKEMVEISLSLDREEPNVAIMRRRARCMEKLVCELKEKINEWNREF